MAKRGRREIVPVSGLRLMLRPGVEVKRGFPRQPMPADLESMKITFDTLGNLLTRLMRLSGASMVRSLDDYRRHQRMASMTKYLGTFEQFTTLAELNESRSAQ